MSDNPILTRREGSALLVQLNRPQRANAINRSMLDAITSLQGELSADSDVKAVVITGSGKNFCAGVDLVEALAGVDIAGTANFEFEFLPQPVIAAINGAAQGGGLEMALACDFRIAGSSSTFGLPEVRFGELPMLGGTVRLTKIVGVSAAKRLVLTGETIDSNQALKIGLVDSVVEDDHVLEEAMKLANQIAANPGFAIRTGKKLVNFSMDEDLPSVLLNEKATVKQMATTEEREFAREDAAKRSPIYRKLFNRGH